MNFCESSPSEPVSAAEINRLSQYAFRKVVAGSEFHSRTLFQDRGETLELIPCARPPTTPVSLNYVRKGVLKGICAFGLLDWTFRRDFSLTEPVNFNQYNLRALARAETGVSVSEDLLTDRGAFKESILIAPSGLYLTWLEASDEVNDFAF